MSVPDAPWIREAEMFGYPPNDDPPVICPVCGAECETVFFSDVRWKDIVACNKCLREQDAYEWRDEEEE